VSATRGVLGGGGEFKTKRMRDLAVGRGGRRFQVGGRRSSTKTQRIIRKKGRDPVRSCKPKANQKKGKNEGEW